MLSSGKQLKQLSMAILSEVLFVLGFIHIGLQLTCLLPQCSCISMLNLDNTETAFISSFRGRPIGRLEYECRRQVTHVNQNGLSFINMHHQPRISRYLRKTNSIYLLPLNSLVTFVENHLILFLNSILCSTDLYVYSLTNTKLS